MIFSSEPPAPIALGDNATGPADAPFVRYTMATRLQIGGNDMASRLLRKFGAQEQIVSTHGMRQRTDNGTETSDITDAEGKRLIHIDHKKKEWSSVTFEDMFAHLDESMAEVRQEQQESGTSAQITDAGVRVERTGATETINGLRAQQTVMVVEGSYEITAQNEETNEQETMRGKSVMVYEMWQSTEAAGYQTLADFNMAAAQAMGAAVENSGFAPMMAAMKNSPQFQEASREAYEKMNPEQGLPVRTRVHFVQLTEDAVLDVDAVLTSAPASETQAVLMTTVTEIGDLSTEPFDEAILTPPADYTEIASPMAPGR